jgi:hypothetical protein
MKHGLSALLLAATLSPAAQAADIDVGVSIGISQPGVYGRIDIGRFPQPVLVQQAPVVIMRPARPVQPVYMWVPPGHQKNWGKHCHRYNACGTPVYFVKDDWYQERVHRGPGRDAYEQGYREGYRDGDRDDDRGHGKGKGHGHGKGQGHGKGRD